MSTKIIKVVISKGFTLVEILIVIAIIIIMIALVMVSTSDYKGKANASTFFSEIRGSMNGLALQCNTGSIVLPANSNNATWASISSSCGSTGTGTYCLSVTNKNAFVMKAIGGCVVYVGPGGIYSNNTCTILADTSTICK